MSTPTLLVTCHCRPRETSATSSNHLPTGPMTSSTRSKRSSTRHSTLHPHLSSFEFTEEGKEHNLAILRKYNFDLGKALEAQQSSPLSYGKEFKPPIVLEQVFSLHPLWQRMKSVLTNGSKWPLTEISKDDRAKDMQEALTFGNHKGASLKPDGPYACLRQILTGGIN